MSATEPKTTSLLPNFALCSKALIYLLLLAIFPHICQQRATSEQSAHLPPIKKNKTKHKPAQHRPLPKPTSFREAKKPGKRNLPTQLTANTSHSTLQHWGVQLPFFGNTFTTDRPSIYMQVGYMFCLHISGIRIFCNPKSVRIFCILYSAEAHC